MIRTILSLASAPYRDPQTLGAFAVVITLALATALTAEFRARAAESELGAVRAEIARKMVNWRVTGCDQIDTLQDGLDLGLYRQQYDTEDASPLSRNPDR